MRISDWSSDVCSSDLGDLCYVEQGGDPRHDVLADSGGGGDDVAVAGRLLGDQRGKVLGQGMLVLGRVDLHDLRHAGRSEEHTSELQSLMRISYAVFCLKKKQTTTRDATQ